MLSELHNLNLKVCSKQYNKNYSTKTRQVGRANEHMYSLMSMININKKCSLYRAAVVNVHIEDHYSEPTRPLQIYNSLISNDITEGKASTNK